VRLFGLRGGVGAVICWMLLGALRRFAGACVLWRVGMRGWVLFRTLVHFASVWLGVIRVALLCLPLCRWFVCFVSVLGACGVGVWAVYCRLE